MRHEINSIRNELARISKSLVDIENALETGKDLDVVHAITDVQRGAKWLNYHAVDLNEWMRDKLTSAIIFGRKPNHAAEALPF